VAGVVSAKFCPVVEGISLVKGKHDSFLGEQLRSFWRACLALYHRAITSDFIRKVAETFVTRILLIGIGLITSVIVARTLGPEGRGLYAVASAISTIGVQFGNLGLHASNTYYVAQNRKLLPALVANTLMVSFGFGGLGAALAWLVCLVQPNLAPVPGLLLVLALAGIPFGLAYLLLQNLLLGINEVRAYNKIEVITKLLTVGFLSLIIITGVVNVETVFSVGLIALVLGFTWSLWQLRKYLSCVPLPSFALLKEHVHYGIKAYLAAFFSFLVLRVDLLMIQYMLGVEQAGYYSIATSMADMLYMLPAVIGTILFPRLAVLKSQQEKWRLTKKVAWVVALLMVILAGVAVLLRKPLVQLIFGEAFVSAAAAFAWLMPGIVILSINTILMNHFASNGMPLIAVYSPGIALVFNLLLNLKLIIKFGIVGASISSVISYAVMLVFSIKYISSVREN
jgi:O-antigen/teichoic acid export membrane protein